MSSLSKTMLIGNLGHDPEVRYTRTGKPVTTISLATTKNWKNKETGQPESHTEWHRLVFFNRLAEIAGEYLRQGSQIYVEGENRTRKWQHSDGGDRYTTEVVCSEMKMLGKNPNAQTRPADGSAPGIEDGSWPTEDDIPFDDNPNSGQQ